MRRCAILRCQQTVYDTPAVNFLKRKICYQDWTYVIGVGVAGAGEAVLRARVIRKSSRQRHAIGIFREPLKGKVCAFDCRCSHRF